MNHKTLIGLALAALIAIVAALAIHRSNAPRSENTGESSTYLVPELRDHVNDVSKVVVTGAEGKTIATLARGANGWTVVEKNGYAVDTGKLRGFLLRLADARKLEEKTSNKDKYAMLGVDDVAAKDAKGMQVELDGLTQPVKLIVGIANERGGGTFVRRVGDDASWLVAGSLTVEKGAADWLSKDLVDIAATRVASVTMMHSDGKSVVLSKDAGTDANFKLADLPKGRDPAADYTLNGPASSLAGLRFDDVLPAKDAPADDKSTKAHFVLFDGLVIDITAWEKEGKDRAQFVASLDAVQADKGIAAAQAKAKAEFDASAAKPATPKDAKVVDEPIKPLAVSDPVKDRANRLAAVNKEVGDLNSRFDGWTYVLPTYKYAGLNETMEDLLKPLDAAKPVAAPSVAKKPAAPKKS
ncbi:MAG: DUF4340 domain-containing protein [Dokdonella sp.]|uniref:DUF4340 domain-containing protein n=1 Tax=Dokdonella sp. TaxID=2291710 RepID=UPI0032632843